MIDNFKVVRKHSGSSYDVLGVSCATAELETGVGG